MICKGNEDIYMSNINGERITQSEFRQIKEGYFTYIYYRCEARITSCGLRYLTMNKENKEFFDTIKNFVEEINIKAKDILIKDQISLRIPYRRPGMFSDVFISYIFDALGDKAHTKTIRQYKIAFLKKKYGTRDHVSISNWKKLHQDNLSFFDFLNAQVKNLKTYVKQCDFFYKQHAHIDWLFYACDPITSTEIRQDHLYIIDLFEKLDQMNINTPAKDLKSFIVNNFHQENRIKTHSAQQKKIDLEDLVRTSGSKEGFLKQMDEIWGLLKETKPLLLCEAKEFQRLFQQKRTLIHNKKRLHNLLLSLFVMVKESEIQNTEGHKKNISVINVMLQENKDVQQQTSEGATPPLERYEDKVGKYDDDTIKRMKNKLNQYFLMKPGTKDSPETFVTLSKHYQTLFKTDYHFSDNFSVLLSKVYPFY